MWNFEARIPCFEEAEVGKDGEKQKEKGERERASQM